VHTRPVLPRLVLAMAVFGLVLVAGCDDAPAARPARSGSAQRPPTLGGTVPRRQLPPSAPMNRLERPVADRLAHRIAPQGLSLAYLDCPRWNGSVPSRITCRGYVDGLVARVAVRLTAAVEGKAVSFDAWLLDGVIATRKLEATLRRQGWATADCGEVPAYPARVGSTIVCRVERRANVRYVAATVSDRAGAVRIADYRATKPAR
jgi:hypothetical protein